MPRFLLIAGVLAAGLVGVSGCGGSSSGGEPHHVKDLKSRGLKDPAIDPMKPGKGEAPGSKQGGEPNPGK